MPPIARRVVVAAAAAAVCLGLTATPAQAAETTHYVALGDSFTAGPLIPHQTGQPLGCFRSDNNYPALVAAALDADEFTDVSCSGAQTVDMFHPQDVPLGVNQPQLDALNESVTLVTLGIGGNDIGFSEILQTCVSRGLFDPSGDPCRQHYVDPDTGADELSQRIADLESDVADLLAEIAQRAPHADVVFTGYLALVPESEGCWPKVPLASGDVPYLHGVHEELNSMLEAATLEHGGVFVDVVEPGRDMCAGHGDRWVEGILPTNPAMIVHPNAMGMEAVAERTLAALD